MTRILRSLTPILLFLLPNSNLADCEGGPVFPELIRPRGQSAFGWGAVRDIEFAKGQLQQVPSYVIWARGRIPNATQIDISHDHPGPGSGLFYLVKTTGSPCGSWQTAPNAEPRRDSKIPAGCSAVAPSDQQLQDAVDGALAAAPNPWGDPDDALLFHMLLQEDLNCAFEIFESHEFAPSATPPPTWDRNDYYCGFGSTAGQPCRRSAKNVEIWTSAGSSIIRAEGALPVVVCRAKAEEVKPRPYRAAGVSGWRTIKASTASPVTTLPRSAPVVQSRRPRRGAASSGTSVPSTGVPCGGLRRGVLDLPAL